MGNVVSLIDEFQKRTIGRAVANSTRAADFLEAKAKEKLGTPYPRASRPGEYPRRRTGRLQREVKAKVRILQGAIVISLESPTPYTGSLLASGRILFRGVIEENRVRVGEMLRGK